MSRMIRVYTDWQSISAVQDALEIPLPATVVARLIALEIFQTSLEVATTLEKLAATIKRGVGITSGSGGGSATIRDVYKGQAAHGISAERNNTTRAVAGGGTLVTEFPFEWDVLSGYQRVDIPETRMEFSPSEVIVIGLEDAPSAARTANWVALLELIGG